MHRVGNYVIPDGPTFDYFRRTYRTWVEPKPRYFSLAEDHWFGEYRPKRGDVIFDIGAGRGEDTLPFSEAVGPEGRVIAIEADPTSFDLLKRLCVLNSLKNVTAFQLAVMDRPGTVNISQAGLWEANTASWASSQSAADAVVEAKTLDDLCKELKIERIDFLKMNIEGAEVPALNGMKSSIGLVNNLCICCHDFRANHGDGESYRTREFVQKFLRDHGFDFHSRNNDPRDYIRDHIHGKRRGA